MHSIRFVLATALLVVLSGWAVANAAPAPPASVEVTDRPGDDGTGLIVKFDKSSDDRAGGSVIRYNIYRRLNGQPLVEVGQVPADRSPNYIFVMGDLTAGTLYGVAVAAYDGATESTKTVLWRTPIDNTPPRPPRNVQVLDVADDNGRALLVKFDASLDDTPADPEVTQYNVYRSGNSSQTGPQIGTVPATRIASYNYRDNTVTSGNTYYYRLRSVAATGESGLTTPVSGTPVDNRPPAPPANVQVNDRPNDEGTALVVNFDKSPDEGAGANDVKGYRIYKRLPGQPLVLAGQIATGGKAKYSSVVTDLTAGQQYGVGVAAWDGTFESSKQILWRTPIDNTPPGPPRNVQVVDVPDDNGRALLVKFDASLDDTPTDTEVTEYQIYRSEIGNQNGNKVGTVPALQKTSYSYRDGTVLPGRTYYYRLRAVAPTGLSPFTTAVSGTPTDDRPPRPPANARLTDRPADDGTALLLTFDRSPDDGAGAGDVIRYHIYKRLPQQPGVKVADVGATGQNTYVYTAGGLKPGQSYGFGVAAWDGTSESAKEILWKAPVDNTPPQPPRNVRITDIPNDQGRALLVKFDASVDDTTADPEVANYQIYRSEISNQNGSQVGTVPATRLATYSYRDGTVRPGTTFYYRLRSVAPTGLSAFTPAVSATPLDNMPPRPPANVQVADRPNDDGGALLVSFDKSPDDGAGANDVMNYRIYRRVAGQPFVKVGELGAKAKAVYTFVVGDLTPGVLYGIAVTAFDGTSESEKTVYWRTPVDNTAPRPPTGLAVTDWPNDDGTSLKVTFNASLDDTSADPEVTRYDIYRASTSIGSGAKVGQLPAVQAPSYQFRNMGLTPGQPYWYWAIAVGATGSSVPSNKASATTLDDRPVRPPLNLTAEDRPYDQGGVVDLAWDRSGDDGIGLNHVAKYHVYRRMANVQQDPTKIAEVTATGASTYNWADTTVPMELILYEYTVTAVSRGGVESAPAGPERAASENNNVVVFQPPTNFTVADVPGDSGGQLALTWNRSTSENDIGPPPPPPVVFSTGEVTTQGGYGGQYEFYRRTQTGAYTTLPTFIVSAAGTNDPMSYIDSNLTTGVKYYYKVRYRRYNQISNFTAEASATPVNNQSGSSSADTSTSDTAGATNADALSVRLIDVPRTVPVGQNVALAIAVCSEGPSSVCLEYSVNGAAAARTAAVVSSGSYGTQITLQTAHLSPGTVVKVRAVVTQEGVTATSEIATMVTATP